MIAASVRTFVVSWKEAAERKDSVARDALVIQKRQPEKVMPQRKYQKKQIRLKNKHYRKLSE